MLRLKACEDLSLRWYKSRSSSLWSWPHHWPDHLNFHQINIIKIVGSSELLYECLCVGYLDVYAGLWTTWKLICETSSSNLPNRTERRTLYQDLDYNEKYRPDGCGLFQRVSFEMLYTLCILLLSFSGWWGDPWRMFGQKISYRVTCDCINSTYRQYGGRDILVV